MPKRLVLGKLLQCPQFFLLLLLTVQAAVSAQSVRAVLEYASSDDVIIIRDRNLLDADDLFGLELYDGDQIQTGRGVSIELRMSGTRAVVRVTENTTFILQAPDAAQSGLQLVYGRIRAKVEKLTGDESFSVQSSGVVAGVRGTDFGYDYIAMRETGMPAARVYCFEGAVEVITKVHTPTTKAENLEPVARRYLLEGGHMLQVQPLTLDTPAEVVPIVPEVKDFWEQNDFVEPVGIPDTVATIDPDTKNGQDLSASDAATAGQVAPLVEVPAAAVSSTGRPQDDQYAALNRLNRTLRIKNTGLATGSILSAVGLGFNAYALYEQLRGNTAMANNFMVFGSIVTSIALPFFIVSLFING